MITYWSVGCLNLNLKKNKNLPPLCCHLFLSLSASAYSSRPSSSNERVNNVSISAVVLDACTHPDVVPSLKLNSSEAKNMSGTPDTSEEQNLSGKFLFKFLSETMS